MNTIRRAERIAEAKVTKETVPACSLIPQGTSHTTGLDLALAFLLVDENIQLRLFEFPMKQQRVNKSGGPNST